MLKNKICFVYNKNSDVSEIRKVFNSLSKNDEYLSLLYRIYELHNRTDESNLFETAFQLVSSFSKKIESDYSSRENSVLIWLCISCLNQDDKNVICNAVTQNGYNSLLFLNHNKAKWVNYLEYDNYCSIIMKLIDDLLENDKRKYISFAFLSTILSIIDFVFLHSDNKHSNLVYNNLFMKIWHKYTIMDNQYNIVINSLT